MRSAAEKQKYLQEVMKGMVMVGQLGFSLVTPPLLLGALGLWLKNRFGLGSWIVLLMLFIGIMTLISTARSYFRDISAAGKKNSGHRPSGTSYFDHR